MPQLPIGGVVQLVILLEIGWAALLQPAGQAAVLQACTSKLLLWSHVPALVHDIAYLVCGVRMDACHLQLRCAV